MLRPRTYPEMLGKALVLEADPFMTMVDDDEPWAEGLFLIIVTGVLVGLAQFIGGLLMTASLPPADALLEAFLFGWRQLDGAFGLSADPAAADLALRQSYSTWAVLGGYGGGWARLLVLISTPMGLIVQWLFFGLIGHGLARVLGGAGTLNKTLGATALMVAPQTLRLLTVVPFVSVGSLLLVVWSVLIAYRAFEVAHELPWRRAVWAALLPPLVLLLLGAALSALIGLFLSVGGGAA